MKTIQYSIWFFFTNPHPHGEGDSTKKDKIFAPSSGDSQVSQIAAFPRWVRQVKIYCYGGKMVASERDCVWVGRGATRFSVCRLHYQIHCVFFCVCFWLKM